MPPAAAEETPSTSSDSPDTPSAHDSRDRDAREQDSPNVILPIPLVTSVEQLAGKWDPHEVLLELSLDEQGDVLGATILEGQEPFASAALRAAPNWKFIPARKNGQPVASKIHFAIQFSQEKKDEDQEAALSKRPDESTNEPAPDGQLEEPSTLTTKVEGRTLDEVLVLGKIEDPAATQITRNEVKNLAGAFDDPLRAIEVMPGVTPIAPGLPLFFVRGAPPGNVGYFIDGIRLPLLYHAFLGPSVIHPAFIRKVELSAGPMPIEYGRYAGAAVEARLREPELVKAAEANIRLIDAGAYVQAPLPQDRGYVQLAGRYSYTALLVSLFSPGNRFDYWDYQGLVGYNLTRRDEISLFALGAFDYAGSKGDVLGGTEYHRVDLRYKHEFSDQTWLRWAVTYGRDRTRSDSGYISDHLVGTRANFEHAAERAVFRSGLDFYADSYSLQVDPATQEPEVFLTLFPSRTDLSGGVWMDVVLFPRGRIQLIPGVRADTLYSLGTTRFAIDPRITMNVELTRDVRAVHSFGVAHQSPNFVPNVPGAQVGGLEGGLQQSIQAATKYEFSLPDNMLASVAGFINTTSNMTDPIGLDQSFSVDETSADQRVLGRAFGLEVFFKRPLTRRLGGLLSYTFAHSLRSFDSTTTKPGYDRTHTLNAALTYDFGFGFRASTKFAIASGIPGRRITADGPIFDQSRSGPYVRLDAKLEKRFLVSPHFDWGISAEVLNATNTGNVTTRSCSPSKGCTNEGTAPITLPLLGVDFAWQ